MTDSLFEEPPEIVVSVMLPVAIASPYSYRVPEGMDVQPGDWVMVPLGPRTVIGVVWDSQPDTPGAPKKLRDIVRRFDCAPMPEKLRRFVEWVAAYTMTDPGSIARMVLRSPDYLEPPPPKKGVRRSGPPPERMTPARRRVLETLEGDLAWDDKSLADVSGVGTSVIKGLVSAGTLEVVVLPNKETGIAAAPDFSAPDLSDDQAKIAADLGGAVRDRGFAVHVLDGVTGSGKTEVYFEAIAQALREGRQSLILLPEIALTTQFLDRFKKRFGAAPHMWHSDIAAKSRGQVWRGTLSGDADVVVGARSALFLPFRDLGLIVVDEEHEAAYKQEDRVWYNARDMAIVRARSAQAPIVLASATPSVETRHNADIGRYKRHILSARFGGRELPSVETIDLRTEGPAQGRWLAPSLLSALKETIENGHQALLFLNRRGYAPLTLCRKCGYRFKCPNCDSWLTEHRFRRQLMCHHCGTTLDIPEKCPDCGEAETLVACGPGVERLFEETEALFPDARVSVLSSDMLVGPAKLREQFAAIERGDVDIVIGTQLIAKGHNFPGLSLVGVIDADMGLGYGDLRATERTFQLISQVVGRAGRGAEPGRAFVQTHMPDHPVLQVMVSGDREAFYERELATRDSAAMPPYTRLAALIISATEKLQAQDYAAHLARLAPTGQADFDVLGPAEAPLALLRGRFRYRFLVRAARHVRLQAVLTDWLARADPPRRSVRVTVDIDPYSFL